MEEELKDRRPIATRDRLWAQKAAIFLKNRGISPNQISIASILFALLAGVCFYQAFCVELYWRIALLVSAAVMIQGRLICNLLDGMVAVEGGMKTAAGAIFNDVPDRVSDSLIFIGVGYGLFEYDLAPVLGWAAALFATLTAYIRVLGGSCGLPQRFYGPMAKPHRMALLTVCAIVASVVSNGLGQAILFWALVVIVFGCLCTCLVRLKRIYQELNNQDKQA